MGSAIEHSSYSIRNIEELARHQERLFHKANGITLKELVQDLETEGFKPYAFSTGEEPLDKIVKAFEIVDDNIRVLDYAKLSRKFKHGIAYIIYKHEEIKMHPSSSHGAPMNVAHCGDYAA